MNIRRDLQEKKYGSSTSINTILNSSSFMPTLKLGISINEFFDKETIKQSFKRIIDEAEKSDVVSVCSPYLPLVIPQTSLLCQVSLTGSDQNPTLGSPA
ncbi:hypothetical protein [Bacillus sp. FSL H8-0515]|uniref:hypothetical protein n=1 Tax=Bacillus sp. FSL H8-0515 TaxID=2921396 RepID=UPI0030FB23D9